MVLTVKQTYQHALRRRHLYHFRNLEDAHDTQLRARQLVTEGRPVFACPCYVQRPTLIAVALPTW